MSPPSPSSRAHAQKPAGSLTPLLPRDVQLLPSTAAGELQDAQRHQPPHQHTLAPVIVAPLAAHANPLGPLLLARPTPSLPALQTPIPPPLTSHYSAPDPRAVKRLPPAVAVSSLSATPVTSSSTPTTPVGGRSSNGSSSGSGNSSARSAAAPWWKSQMRKFAAAKDRAAQSLDLLKPPHSAASARTRSNSTVRDLPPSVMPVRARYQSDASDDDDASFTSFTVRDDTAASVRTRASSFSSLEPASAAGAHLYMQATTAMYPDSVAATASSHKSSVSSYDDTHLLGDNLYSLAINEHDDAHLSVPSNPPPRAPSPLVVHGAQDEFGIEMCVVDDSTAEDRVLTPSARVSPVEPRTTAAPAAPAPALAPAAAQEGEFGLPPAGHAFWTDIRIFDLDETSGLPLIPTPAHRAHRRTARAHVHVDPDGRLAAVTTLHLVELVTSTLDYQFGHEFLLVYREFMTPVQLLRLLMLRFQWTLAPHPVYTDKKMAEFRMRIFVIFKLWITNFYLHDFAPSADMHRHLRAFITSLEAHPAVKDHPASDSARIVANLTKLLEDEEHTYHRELLPSYASNAAPGEDFSAWRHRHLLEQQFPHVYAPIRAAVAADAATKRTSVSANASAASSRRASGTGPASGGTAPRDSALVRTGSTGSMAAVASVVALGLRNAASARPVSAGSVDSGFSSDDHDDGDELGDHVAEFDAPVAAAALAASAAPGSRIPRALAARLCTSRSFLLELKLDAIADHFTVIEELYFLGVPWDDLLAHKAGSAESAPLRALTDRFNTMTLWAMREVCAHAHVGDRVKVVERLIQLAAKCAARHNFATLYAIMASLQNPAIERLRKTWAKVSSADKKVFKDLLALTQVTGNFHPLRQAMAKALESGAPGIPFTYLFVHDVELNRATPAVVATVNAVVPSDAVGTVALPLINWTKFRQLAGIIDAFRQFQKRPAPAQAQHAPIDVTVYANCVYLWVATPAEISDMSHACERVKP
ncbi:hypothetical protein AMAG_09372 [Allomyces macrogynus ATCC 38327]|uniref:Ras-GEF domain-containing protein n=1 Tax=Allomyces macrogynus (strain ATCC 38327) TaxID=578462 RepID=A0A0L0SPN3_ALLM3|nr:hypothetical protein AMAG_09372 [Allomyces macrogynus ATCC 38327]|eukprot:KNE64345.1 hypothetical protein AMAG_09372 [Allomyces macrogynus ATCC 38327]